MSDSRMDFAGRLRRLDRKHRALSRGSVTALRADGLIVTKSRHAGPRINPRAVLMFLAAFFAFKGLMIASIGPEGYGERVDTLAAGTLLEQAGAIVMQANPITIWASEHVACRKKTPCDRGSHGVSYSEPSIGAYKTWVRPSATRSMSPRTRPISSSS